MKRAGAVLLGLALTAGMGGCNKGVELPDTSKSVPESTKGSLQSPSIQTPPPGKESPPK